MRQLEGKRVLVTGASGGLGLHFAQVLAREGAMVTLGARRENALAEAVAGITAAGGRASHVLLDVGDTASVEAAFEGPAYDIVVNNAGVTHEGPALSTTPEDWRRVIDTDLTGVFTVAQAAAQRLVDEKRPGSIINIASILGLRVAGHVAAYATAKAGVVQLSRSLALEWARHGIRVNTLCPGYIETDLNRDFFASDAGQALIRRVPQRRLGQPEDLDGPLLLLASDASRFMTGTEIVADGGHLVSSL
ncbi:NAD(P)-dependent dehydrogenase, short-chain alcohol dehydrogenase family [Roseovarius pacificus]|uniref:NAD(P)-dependent dehydrogenase, short-chain alcohol dehydrogenase family n=1 Tax=Roseovarius pacificus TaxID=337701 RepID=A0A1M7GVW4_9RHOB|nr:SDR family oxidoreductase [Roseovarius pacificus]GGO60171.1 short-chain dehydrogenase/reductase [Roseovarius pacificus]SHM20365.1 NAD(P)-dependent dehydrogenase, short-chain alcohol dehydrogenase family [Roseovarius pacificus]